MAAAWQQGDACEVWSNSTKAWIKGARVALAPTADSIIEGYSVRRGTVKVSFGQHEKWITPQDVATLLRPVGAAAAPAPPVPSAGSSAGSRRNSRTNTGEHMCKSGCGRPVQIGMTRGLKLFDTCCKRCAQRPGMNEHDLNCGGNQARSEDSTAESRGENPRRWLEAMLDDAALLDNHIQGMWSTVAGDAGAGSVKQAWSVIENELLEPIGENMRIKDKDREKCMKQVDPSSRAKDQIEQDLFAQLCRHLLEESFNKWFPPKLPTKTRSFVRKNPLKVEEVYAFEQQKLGEGSFGTVYSVVHKISGERRVCKKIAKMKGRQGMEVEDILQEIESMASLDHPNVIKVYEYFEDACAIYQIREPCRGGELQDHIDAVFRKQTAEMYSEVFMSDVIKQILRALAFMHSERFMHKDLKPQNIMLVDQAVAGASTCSIKVIDFGLAELFSPDQEHSDQLGGTLLYMAPEVLHLELTMKSDIWSVGVILYNLVTGDYPFMAQWPVPRGRDTQWWQAETCRLIQDPRQKHKPNPKLSSASPLLLDFLNQLFQKDPRLRPDAAECLRHPWFKSFESTPPPLSIGVIQCLEAYSWQPELKKALFLLIAHQSTAPALQELRAIFTHFDVQNRGALDSDVFREVLCKSDLSLLDVECILDSLDRDSSGVIQWTEFIAAALCISVCRSKPLVHAAFAVFDQDCDGEVSSDDILDVFAEGDGKQKWDEQIVSECEELASGAARAAGPFTKENFEKYVGAHMYVSSGAALRAVTG